MNSLHAVRFGKLLQISSALIAAAFATSAIASAQASALASLQGAWNLIAVTDEGSTAPPDALRGAQAIFAGDKMTLVSPDGKDRTEYSIKLDSTKSPKEIDLTPLAGSFKGQTAKAIYDLQGDTLRICQPEQPSQPRPTSLSAPAGSKLNLMTLKKAAK